MSEAVAESVVMPEMVALFVGVVREMVGKVVSERVFETVTETGLVVVVFPAASKAIALKVCVPFERVAVLKSVVYDEVVDASGVVSVSL